MLEGISWQQYITTLGSLLGVYYAALLVWSGMGKWKRREYSSGRPPQPNLTEVTEQEYHGSEATIRNVTLEDKSSKVKDTTAAEEAQKASLLDQMYDMLYELEAYFAQAGTGHEPSLLIDSVRRILHKYPSLKGSTFQPELNQFIQDKAMEHCEVAMDINSLWLY